MAERIPVKEGTFIETDKGGIMLANKCNKCGQAFFPKVNFCLTCLNQGMEDIKLSRKGKLYSYTNCFMPSMHFTPPYSLGFIDMPEGVRIFAPLKVKEDKPFKVDMDMQLVIEPLWQEGDKEIIGYKFQPV